MKNKPEVMARHARVLKILTCLQSGPGFNARQLADHLKVSRRTVFRDLSIIRDSGVVVFFDSIADAYRIHPGSQPEPLRLDEEDFAWITGKLVDIAGERCDGRIVSTLEGGYDLDALASSVTAHVGELMRA